MTRAQIKTLVRGWLDDPNGTYFIDTDVNTWINLAHRQLQMMLLQAGNNWYMKPVESYTVVGQSDYLFPSDFMVEHRIEVILSGSGTTENRQPLVAISTNEQDFVPTTSGNPACYYIKKDRFTISPTPATAQLMRLYYSPLVTDLAADSDTPDCPEQFMEYIALLAAFNGYIKDDRAPQNLMAKKAEFEALLKQMSVERTQDRSRQVIMATDYDAGGAWY